MTRAAAAAAEYSKGRNNAELSVAARRWLFSDRGGAGAGRRERSGGPRRRPNLEKDAIHEKKSRRHVR